MKNRVYEKKGTGNPTTSINLEKTLARNLLLWKVNIIILNICVILILFNIVMFWNAFYAIFYNITYLFIYLHIPLITLKKGITVSTQLFRHDFIEQPVSQITAVLTFPFQYVFSLYQRATPGEQLTILYLPVGGIIGSVITQLMQGRKKRK